MAVTVTDAFGGGEGDRTGKKIDAKRRGAPRGERVNRQLVRVARESVGFTQAELAKITGLSVRTLHSMETGHAAGGGARHSTVGLVARVLGLPLSWCMTDGTGDTRTAARRRLGGLRAGIAADLAVGGFRVPTMPAGYFRRPRIDDAIAAFLDTRNRRAPLCLLGQPGVGKTAAVLNAVRVHHERFLGGVVWVDVANALLEQRDARTAAREARAGVLSALGLHGATSGSTVSRDSLQLSAEFWDGPRVVVLDGVTSPEFVDAFTDGRVHRMPVIVTTRLRSVARALGGDAAVEVAPFSNAEAKALFAARGLALSEERTAALNAAVAGRPALLRAVCARLVHRPDVDVSALVKKLATSRKGGSAQTLPRSKGAGAVPRNAFALFDELKASASPSAWAALRWLWPVANDIFPVEWAARMAAMQLAELRPALAELHDMQLLDVEAVADGGTRYSLRPYVDAYSEALCGRDSVCVAFGRYARAVLDGVSSGVPAAFVREHRSHVIRVFDALAGVGRGSAYVVGLAPADRPSLALSLVGFRSAFAGLSIPGADVWFDKAWADGRSSDVDRAALALTRAEWVLRTHADFRTAAIWLRRATDAYATASDLEGAVDAALEEGRAHFVENSPMEGIERFDWALKTAEQHSLDTNIVAGRKSDLGITWTRPPVVTGTWVEAIRLFEDGLRDCGERDDCAATARVLRVNLAVADSVLNQRTEGLATSLAELLAHPFDLLTPAYVRLTGVAFGVRVTEADSQREVALARRAWHDAFADPVSVEVVLWRLGALAFYLNAFDEREANGTGDFPTITENLSIAECSAGPSGRRRTAGPFGFLFRIDGMARIVDVAFVRRALEFVRTHAGAWHRAHHELDVLYRRRYGDITDDQRTIPSPRPAQSSTPPTSTRRGLPRGR